MRITLQYSKYFSPDQRTFQTGVDKCPLYQGLTFLLQNSLSIRDINFMLPATVTSIIVPCVAHCILRFSDRQTKDRKSGCPKVRKSEIYAVEERHREILGELLITCPLSFVHCQLLLAVNNNLLILQHKSFFTL